MSRDDYRTAHPDLQILDESHDGDHVRATIENAERALPLLSRGGYQFRTVDLNLDEIFEAYVAGRRISADASAQPQPELQPVP
jgi:hypothetical protein